MLLRRDIMKIKRRAIALLLSMVMVLTFMPALAFAEETAAEDSPAVELTAAPEVTEAAPASNTEDGNWDLWFIDASSSFFYPWHESGDVDFELYGCGYNSSGKTLTYEWSKDGSLLDSGSVTVDADEEFSIPYVVTSAGTYVFTVKEDAENEASMSYTVHKALVQNHLLFGDIDNNTAFVQEDWEEEPTGNIVVPPTVTLPDGRNCAVKEVYIWAPNATSCSIPASVTYVNSVGIKDYDHYDDETDTYVGAVIIPGFVIYGTNGSAAQAHAKKYGIAFRDLAAEQAAAAEAARQGTQVAGLPKVKISKPAAAKKKVTVKWKKLSKKDLKKGVTNIEVWVCPNSAFGPADTKIVTVGKKKASAKVKGLAKGTYFVKVRAIKNVGGVKQYTAWSKVKKVKVKK